MKKLILLTILTGNVLALTPAQSKSCAAIDKYTQIALTKFNDLNTERNEGLYTDGMIKKQKDAISTEWKSSMINAMKQPGYSYMSLDDCEDSGYQWKNPLTIQFINGLNM